MWRQYALSWGTLVQTVRMRSDTMRDKRRTGSAHSSVVKEVRAVPPRNPSGRLTIPFKIPRPRGVPEVERLGSQSREGPTGLGDPETVTLLERAIASCSQIEAIYDDDSGDEPRVFCPAAIGTLHDDRNLLVRQISGESGSGYEKGQDRCLKVAKMRNVRLREGPWFPIETDIRKANCFKNGKIEKYSQCPDDPPRTDPRR